jgi:thiol-disulfide isomerase/thioredoxin
MPLTLFHMNGCGHCVALKPKWQKNKQKYKDLLPIEDIEYSENPAAAKKYNVNGFPTIIFTHKGKKVIEYNGDRSAKDLENFTKACIVYSKKNK